MGKNIYLLSHLILTIIWFTELIVALKVTKDKAAPAIMKKLFWYPLIGSIIGVTFFLEYLDILTLRNVFFVNTFSLLFHFSFLSYFIYNVTGKINIFLILISSFFLIIFVLIVSDTKTGYVTSFAFANGCLFCFSLYYFSRILNGIEKINLRKNPVFLVCCGIFIGSGLIVPSTLMIKYMYLLNIHKETIYLVFGFSQAGYILLNLFFIKALLCSRQTKNISD
jgi:hypothetical protein